MTALKWLERLLMTVGIVALAYVAFLWGRAEYDQHADARMLDQLVEKQEATGTVTPRPSNLREGDLVGRIEIPRLDLEAIVLEGTTDDTLARGIGHLSTSGRPGQNGNLVLAGHRDTFFRSLRGVRSGDVVEMTTPQGRSRYVIDSTRVVDPDAVEVLRASGGSTITLITCFPFNYIGSAPQRFIVKGRRLPDPVKLQQPL